MTIAEQLRAGPSDPVIQPLASVVGAWWNYWEYRTPVRLPSNICGPMKS
jgi:hypothetical protein